MTRTKKTSVLFLSIVMAISFCVGGLGFAGVKLNAIADGNNYYATSSNGVLKYNSDEFEVIEDYSAFVPAAVASPNGGVQLLDPNGEQLMRLDQGKKGLLVKSVQTGNDVEGDSFSFANAMVGNFEMDFRIFSEKTLESGVPQLKFQNLVDASGNTINNSANRAAIENDDALPALDIRQVGITFRSITNPTKAFTVYVRSGEQGAYNHEVSLRVGIEGEKWYSWYMGANYPGYGLLNGTTANDYGYNTAILGTSMSNGNIRDVDTFSTTIKFDVEKMCVYGVNKSANVISLSGIGEVGANYTSTDVLVRNLATNNTKDDNSGDMVTGNNRLNQLTTLSSADFIGGYTTSVTILDMTSDDTVLTKAVSDSTGGDVYSNAVTEKVADPYKRYAKMLIYSVNGQEFVKNDEWTVDYVSGDTIAEYDTAKGVAQLQGYNGSVVNASYDTSVKNGSEQGSTKIAFTGSKLEFSTLNPYIRYHGNKAQFTLPVYITGTENNYIVQAWTTSGTKLYGGSIAPNTWTNITFKSNANWNFDLHDVYFAITKANTNLTEVGASIHLGKMTVQQDGALLPTKHLQLTSSAKNISAEGNAYGLQSADFKMSDGTYILGMTAKSENYATKAGTETTDLGDYYTKNVYSTAANGQVYIGTGSGTYQKDPYSDVRELGLTIRSTIDPTQAFTIYLSSSTFRRARTSIRVGVEGENYVNGSGQKGFSYVSNTNTGTYRENLQKSGPGGTMGQWGTTADNGIGAYNSMNELFSYVKFDPTTMTVYSYNYSWVVARKLSSNMLGDATNSACDTLKTLNASDFANGSFTMEISVEEMNTEWNKGLSNVYSLMNGVQTAHSIGYDVLSESYDRKCIIDVVSGRLNSGIALDNETAYATNQPGYEVTYDWIDMSTLKANADENGITLTAPSLVNLFGTEDYSGVVNYVSANREDIGDVTFVDGVAKFEPKTTGDYNFILDNKVAKVTVYGVTVNGKVIYGLDSKIKLSDLEVEEVSGLQFVGYTIDGLDGIYSSEYELDLTANNVVTAKYIDIAMTEGASIRFSATTPGIRFRATISKEVADEFLSLANGQVSFTYSITANGITKEQVVDFNNIIYNEETGYYEMYAAVIGLADTQYETKFDASVKATLTTADGETITLNALKAENSSRSIKEVAISALEKDENLTNGQIKLLKEFAGITASEE